MYQEPVVVLVGDGVPPQPRPVLSPAARHPFLRQRGPLGHCGLGGPVRPPKAQSLGLGQLPHGLGTVPGDGATLAAVSQQTVQIAPVQRLSVLPPRERTKLQRRARLLAWGGIAWHFIEFGIAVGAGIAASSIALIGFGADSLIEALAGFVVGWLFTGSRVGSHEDERRAQQPIAIS